MRTDGRTHMKLIGAFRPVANAPKHEVNLLPTRRKTCLKTPSLWSGDRIPVAARFSASVQTGRGAHPASYTMGTGSLPGGKAAKAWPWPFIPIERWDYRLELYFYSPSAPSPPVLRRTLPLPLLRHMPRGLRRRSATASLLGLRVRVLLGEWMHECCVL
jgi:hypothetical protein